MSSRALKKLTNKKDELKELDRINKLAIGSDEQESEDEIVVPYVPNKFSLVGFKQLNLSRYNYLYVSLKKTKAR